ncbi:MAG TPA: VWA domain-containing protein [Pyrinomonadaceae bacterium]|nr:VWA domain-containing protein [Pyrinomonadaceae bacterium]
MKLRTPTLAFAAALLLLSASPRAGVGRAGDDAGRAQEQPSQERPAQQPQQQQPAPLLTPQPTPTPARPETVDEDEVLNVETSLVNVLFNAADRNRRYVTAIRREDVRVFENDAPQEITAFQHETNLPVSIAILIDVSFSQAIALPDAQQAAKRFVNSILRPGRDEVAVLSFAGTTTVEQDLTDNAIRLHRAIDSVEIEPPADKDTFFEYQEGERAEVVPARNDLFGLPGSTALWDAVWAASTELMARAPRNARRALIVLSDGDDTTSRVRREEAVQAAVKANTVIYTIGFEPDCDPCPFDKKALRRLAEETGGRAFFPKRTAEFDTAFGQIEHELRTQYLLSYVPTNRERDGSFRRIRLDITNPELRKQKIKLTYREGYYALPPRPRPPRRTDAQTETQQRLKRPPRRPRKN